jgi:hypothetical protein
VTRGTLRRRTLTRFFGALAVSRRHPGSVDLRCRAVARSLFLPFEQFGYRPARFIRLAQPSGYAMPRS